MIQSKRTLFFLFITLLLTILSGCNGDDGDNQGEDIGSSDPLPGPTIVFTSQSNVALSSLITSNTVTVDGIATGANISITNGEYEIDNNGNWTNTAATIDPGSSVRVRHTSASTNSTTVMTTLTVAGVDANFSSTTIAAVLSGPNIVFNDQTDVPLSTVITSNEANVDNIAAGSSISIVNGEYEINNSGSWTGVSSTIDPSSSVRVRHTSAVSNDTTVTTVLTVAGVDARFSSTTTAAVSSGPNIVFNDQTDVPLSTVITSNSANVDGIAAGSSISIVNGEYEINNSGSWSNADATIDPGSNVRIRHTSAATNSTTVTSILTVAGVASSFNSITIPGSGGGLRVNAITGSDTNTYAQVTAGTHKWASIGRALWGQTQRPSFAEFRNPPSSLVTEAAQPGDTIIVEAGTYYADAVPEDRWSAAYLPINNGSAGNYITVRAEGLVILSQQPAAAGTASSATDSTLTVSGAGWSANQWRNHVVRMDASGTVGWISSNDADTLTIQGSWSQGYSPDGSNNPVMPQAGDDFQLYKAGFVLGVGTAGGLDVTRQYIRWTGLSDSDWFRIDTESYFTRIEKGLLGAAYSDHLVLENIDHYRPTYTSYSDNSSSLRIQDAQHIVIRNCRIGVHGNNGNNVAAILTYSGQHVLVEHNEFDNGELGLYIKGEFREDAPNQGWTIRYNRFTNHKKLIYIFAHSGPTSSYLYGNLAYDFLQADQYPEHAIRIATTAVISNFEIWNNTIYGKWSPFRITSYVQAPQNVVVKNNIFHGGVGTGVFLREINMLTGISMDYNLLYSFDADSRFAYYASNAYTLRTDWTAATGFEQNGFFAAPQFDDAANNVFTISTGPAIDSGEVNPTLHGSVTQVDIGAYARGTEVMGNYWP
jgi:predicted thioesterase